MTLYMYVMYAIVKVYPQKRTLYMYAMYTAVIVY